MAALQILDSEYKLGNFAEVGDRNVFYKPRITVHTIAAAELKRLQQTREDALDGYYYFNSVLRRFSAPDFKTRAEEREFWEAVTFREKCEQVYEELSDISL